MKRLSMLLVAALMTGGSALASAQPADHDGRRFEDRDRGRDRDGGRDRYFDRDHAYNNGRFNRDHDRDDRRFFRDRDRFFDRDEHRYFVGERRFFNGYNWNWDGQRWCRRDGRVMFYFNF